MRRKTKKGHSQIKMFAYSDSCQWPLSFPVTNTHIKHTTLCVCAAELLRATQRRHWGGTAEEETISACWLSNIGLHMSYIVSNVLLVSVTLKIVLSFASLWYSCWIVTPACDQTTPPFAEMHTHTRLMLRSSGREESALRCECVSVCSVTTTHPLSLRLAGVCVCVCRTTFSRLPTHRSAEVSVSLPTSPEEETWQSLHIFFLDSSQRHLAHKPK